MAVVIASALDKDIAGTPLFRGVSFKLERGDRMTLAGRNGAGKTTLLRMVAGETGVDGGELAFEKGARVALHDQRPPRERGLSVRDYVLAGCRDLVALEEELRGLEGEMAERPEDRDLLDRYSRAQGRLEHAGGCNWRERAMAPLHGLGFADAQLDRSLDTFSGGELTRASLARVLAADPDLLLLDEPTNHLDISSLEWLEGYLVDLDAAVVLVAHDRWFLEAVGTSVLELEAGRSRFFPGSWHNWRMEAAAREIQLGKQIEKQQTEIARMERFIERFRYKATKARQAQSRVKRLEKMERIERDPRDNRSLGFSFGTAERTGRVVLELEGERRRLSLAILVSSGANVLILDEPTNHLDLDAREALEDALSSFGGAVLLVSHDRALLDAVGTRTFALEDGRLRSYEGGWAEYSRVREERRQAEAEAHERARSEKSARRRSNGADRRGRREPPAGPSKNQQRRIAELERDVERAERELAELEDELADPSQWLSPTSRERSTERHAEARRAVERAYAAWEEATR